MLAFVWSLSLARRWKELRLCSWARWSFVVKRDVLSQAIAMAPNFSWYAPAVVYHMRFNFGSVAFGRGRLAKLCLSVQEDHVVTISSRVKHTSFMRMVQRTFRGFGPRAALCLYPKRSNSCGLLGRDGNRIPVRAGRLQRQHRRFPRPVRQRLLYRRSRRFRQLRLLLHPKQRNNLRQTGPATSSSNLMTIR